MTASRIVNQSSGFIDDFAVNIPLPADAADMIFCATDTGLSYFSDGVAWHEIGFVQPGGPDGLRLDYDTGNISQWRLAQVAQPYSITFSDSLRRINSGFSGRFEVRSGDDPLGLGTERAEVLGPVFFEGDETWCGWSTWFTNNDPIGEYISLTLGSAGVGKTNTFSDFHENRGAQQQFPTSVNIPPFELNVNTQGAAPYLIRLRVSGGAVVNNVAVTPPTFYVIQEPILYNQWNDFIVHMIHSSNPLVGGFEIWINGVRPADVPSMQTRSTMYEDRQSYFKQGWYRNANLGTSVVYHDMTQFGASKNAVDPARFD